jgi:nitroreductase / dihydropteridine reductase
LNIELNLFLHLHLHLSQLNQRNMSLINSLKWRYAAKKMSGEKITDEQLNNILEATRLSASSFGLQPYTILVVSNEDLKKDLRTAAFDQSQVSDSSHLLVFTIWDSIQPEHVDQYMNDIATSRGTDISTLSGFRETLLGTVNRLGKEQQQVWATKQAYIALGTAIAAAAETGVDASPMEGFDPQQFDNILGLKEKNLKSVVILALGKRSVQDDFAKAPKVRRASEQLYQFVA